MSCSSCVVPSFYFLALSVLVAWSLDCCCCQAHKVNQRQLYRHKRTKRARVKRLLRKRAAHKRDALALLVLKKRDVRSSMTAWDNERPEVRHGGVGLSRVDRSLCLLGIYRDLSPCVCACKAQRVAPSVRRSPATRGAPASRQLGGEVALERIRSARSWSAGGVGGLVVFLLLSFLPLARGPVLEVMCRHHPAAIDSRCIRRTHRRNLWC